MTGVAMGDGNRDIPYLLGVGMPLHGVAEYLELVRPLIEDEADYFEVAPESLSRPTRDGGLERNAHCTLFAELKRRSGRPFVAHGLEFSIGGDAEDARERRRLAPRLAMLRDLHATFAFAWFSDHLGWTCAGGLDAILPLPLPPTREAVLRVAERLRAIAAIVPTVAFENPAGFMRLGPPGLDASFWNAICREAPAHLMLDLHNVHTEAINLGHDPHELLARVDLDRVIQIHLSGGSESDPRWLASRRVTRLDSHDAAIPEAVWNLLEHVLPLCSNLRGIVVERLDGTLAPDDVPALRDEMRRAKAMLADRVLVEPPVPPASPELPEGGGLSELQELVTALIADSDSLAALRAANLPSPARDAVACIDSEGWRLTSLIVRKLRFERMCLADGAFRRAFEENGAAVVRQWEAFVRAIPPRAIDAFEEARAFRAWSARGTEGVER